MHEYFLRIIIRVYVAIIHYSCIRGKNSLFVNSWQIFIIREFVANIHYSFLRSQECYADIVFYDTLIG